MTEVEITLSRLRHQDLTALEVKWRELEATASTNFFTSWTWIGCAIQRRMTAPMLLEAHTDDRAVALALFNQTGIQPKVLWLSETGSAQLDDVYIEHNGILIAQDARPDLRSACLAACIDDGFLGPRIMCSGVTLSFAVDASRAGGSLRVLKTSVAPRIKLDALPNGYLASLSPNTRYQIRRSERQHRERGELHLDRAEDLSTAHLYLDALAKLHQKSWNERGRPGAFANPKFLSFHRELIDRGLPRGEIDLLRISAGDHVVGYLYNFRHCGTASAYQSGFDYDGAKPYEKPGLTCHHLAIEWAISQDCATYDFLAGEDRYKKSLANDQIELVWIEATRAGSALSFLLAGHDRVRALSKRAFNGARMLGKAPDH